MIADLTPAKDGQIAHDMEDDVIQRYGYYQGDVTYPPPPPKVAAIAAQKPKEVKEQRLRKLRQMKSPPLRRRPNNR